MDDISLFVTYLLSIWRDNKEYSLYGSLLCGFNNEYDLYFLNLQSVKILEIYLTYKEDRKKHYVGAMPEYAESYMYYQF